MRTNPVLPRNKQQREENWKGIIISFFVKVSFYPVKAPRYDAALVSENKTLGKLETETCGKTETQILIEGKYKHKKYQAKQSNSPQGLITSLYDQS